MFRRLLVAAAGAVALAAAESGYSADARDFSELTSRVSDLAAQVDAIARNLGATHEATTTDEGSAAHKSKVGGGYGSKPGTVGGGYGSSYYHKKTYGLPYFEKYMPSVVSSPVYVSAPNPCPVSCSMEAKAMMARDLKVLVGVTEVRDRSAEGGKTEKGKKAWGKPHPRPSYDKPKV
jgi:hypothetical protein